MQIFSNIVFKMDGARAPAGRCGYGYGIATLQNGDRSTTTCKFHANNFVIIPLPRW